MWIHKNTFAIGGLEEIGFAKNSDLILVLSGQGEGIFNVLTGELIGRRENDYEWWERYDKTNNKIVGFDILGREKIATSGLISGDQLLKQTPDDWTLENEYKDGNDAKTNLFYKGLFQKNIGEDGPCELRAYGFSETGNSLVFATSCELILYSREVE